MTIWACEVVWNLVRFPRAPVISTARPAQRRAASKQALPPSPRLKWNCARPASSHTRCDTSLASGIGTTPLLLLLEEEEEEEEEEEGARWCCGRDRSTTALGSTDDEKEEEEDDEEAAGSWW